MMKFRLYGPRCGGCLETVSPRDLVRKAREKVLIDIIISIISIISIIITSITIIIIIMTHQTKSCWPLLTIPACL